MVNIQQTCYKFMQEAIDLAKLSKIDIPVGSVIVCDNQIIAKAHNQREELNDATNHAEIIAIRQACSFKKNWRLKNCQIYCTLEPCPMCTEAIIQSRIESVYFGAYDLKQSDLNLTSNLLNPKRNLPIPKIYGGIMEEECGFLLKEFFKNEVRYENEFS